MYGILQGAVTHVEKIYTKRQQMGKNIVETYTKSQYFVSKQVRLSVSTSPVLVLCTQM